jgi:hypothetical protein
MEILDKVVAHSKGIQNPFLQRRVMRFIDYFKQALSQHTSTVPLPSLHKSESVNSTISYEWVYDNMRWCFNLEEDDSKSYWYIVAKDRINRLEMNATFDGKFQDDMMEEILMMIIPWCIERVTQGTRISRLFK